MEVWSSLEVIAPDFQPYCFIKWDFLPSKEMFHLSTLAFPELRCIAAVVATRRQPFFPFLIPQQMLLFTKKKLGAEGLEAETDRDSRLRTTAKDLLEPCDRVLCA